jgi:hypothetical protein
VLDVRRISEPYGSRKAPRARRFEMAIEPSPGLLALQQPEGRSLALASRPQGGLAAWRRDVTGGTP